MVALIFNNLSDQICQTISIQSGEKECVCQILSPLHALLRHHIP